jgi:ribA/ribD-fused uncharacterized protein
MTHLNKILVGGTQAIFSYDSGDSFLGIKTKESLRTCMTETIYFYSQRVKYGEFSNFYPAPITIRDKVWPTSEHYYQAMKFEAYPEVMEKIRLMDAPGQAAKMGRSRKLPLRTDWEKIKEAVMMDALRAKFTQHPDLKELLLSTGDAILVEHTKRDFYWGDGLGGGKNRLGHLLMVLRRELGVVI